MGAMTFQITGVSIVYSTVVQATPKKTPKLRATCLCEGNSTVTGEFPAQRASNAKHVSTWWLLHAFPCHYQTEVWPGNLAILIASKIISVNAHEQDRPCPNEVVSLCGTGAITGISLALDFFFYLSISPFFSCIVTTINHGEFSQWENEPDNNTGTGLPTSQHVTTLV